MFLAAGLSSGYLVYRQTEIGFELRSSSMSNSFARASQLLNTGFVEAEHHLTELKGQTGHVKL